MYIRIGDRVYTSLGEIVDPSLRFMVKAALRLGPSQMPREAASFVEEVERLARERLLRDPRLARTELYLTVDSDNFLHIEVDGRSYSSVEEIADPRVRRIIVEAVKQWEGL